MVHPTNTLQVVSKQGLVPVELDSTLDIRPPPDVFLLNKYVQIIRFLEHSNLSRKRF